MLTALLLTAGRAFCRHEWMTRSRQSRLYVECVKCLATSPGIEVRPGGAHRVLTRTASAHRAPRSKPIAA